MPRFAYPVKLVRDRVSERIGENRSFHYERFGNRKHHIKLLRAKLLEEAAEYVLEPSMGELADVFEVVRALADIDLASTYDALVAAADAKAAQRGGFEVGTLMVATDDGAVGETRPEWKEERG